MILEGLSFGLWRSKDLFEILGDQEYSSYRVWWFWMVFYGRNWPRIGDGLSAHTRKFDSTVCILGFWRGYLANFLCRPGNFGKLAR